MDPASVFGKTGKGQEEIANRTYKLPPRMRALLIMIDGKSSIEELAARAASLGGIAPMLAELAAQGFIADVRGQAQPASAAPGPAPASPAADGPPRSIEEARRYAISQILSLLGPNGDPLAERLEKANTREALVAEGTRCHQTLLAVAGSQKADRFRDGLNARLP